MSEVDVNDLEAYYVLDRDKIRHLNLTSFS